MMTSYVDNSVIPKHCVWSELFDEDERIILQDGFMFIGFISIMLSAWLTITLLLTNLRYDTSYRNLAYFTATSCIRRIMPVFSHLAFLKYFESLCGFQTFSCEFFAFFETFLAVFEVECLTHVCIERYVVAKYITNGWQINRKHCTLYLCLCLFFSCLYSIPPLFGIGSYGLDFDCSSCTFDMALSDDWEGYFIIAIFLFRSVKPAIVMLMMLIWARVLERKPICSMKQREYITRSIMVITLANLICWSPIAFVRGCVLLSYIMEVDPLLLMSPFYVKWAMWIHWGAPAFTAVVVICIDKRVRNKMFNLFSKEENASSEIHKVD